MKNVTRNKFLLCFRPVVEMDENKEHSREDIKNSKNSLILHSPRKTCFPLSLAGFFGIILIKRVHYGRGLTQDSHSSSSSSSSPSKSSHSASPSSTSMLEEQNIYSNEENTIPTPNEESGSMKGKRMNNIIGLYFILFSLAVTVFWGKVYAILVTLILLCFLPHRKILLEHGTKLPERKESEKY
ncbi:uncharacterized protein [Euphorbia lathyris]|uniref:uncharacterized protein n=1 Tax=Euphorbia lathyris TaxID=212925 RepID=UPI00331398B2